MSQPVIPLTRGHDTQIINTPKRAKNTVFLQDFILSSSPPAVKIWNQPYITTITDTNHTNHNQYKTNWIICQVNHIPQSSFNIGFTFSSQKAPFTQERVNGKIKTSSKSAFKYFCIICAIRLNYSCAPVSDNPPITQLTNAHEIHITNTPINALIRVVFHFFTLSSSHPAVKIWNQP